MGYLRIQRYVFSCILRCICDPVLCSRNDTNGLGLHHITPSLSPLKRDITPRHNVRVITINLYDRFTSYRILCVIYRVRRAFEGDFSTSHDSFFHADDMYVGIFFLQEDGETERSFKRPNSARLWNHEPAAALTRNSEQNNDGRYANTMLGFCYESMRSLN